MTDGVGIDGLIFYVDDLENLVRWFSHLYSYEDPTTGDRVTNDPIWATVDSQGNDLPEGRRLKRTWDRVMHPPGQHVAPGVETLPPNRPLIPGEEGAPM